MHPSSPEHGGPEVKPKLSPSPDAKIPDASNDSSEVAILRRLLAEKSRESLDLEIKLLKALKKVDHLEAQNKRLEGELRRHKIHKHEANRKKVQSPSGTFLAKQEPLEREVIMLLESESEDERPKPQTERLQTQLPDLSSEATEARAVSPVVENSEELEEPTKPPRDAWASIPDSAVPAGVKDEDEVIDVIIKAENDGEPDLLKRVYLIKSEDGNFDIWNVDAFGLAPAIEVDEKYNRGFSRKVISDAFGGGHQTCNHNWGKPGKMAFCTYNRSWNNALPPRPGAHGMGFFGLSGASGEPMNFFVGEGTNDWRLAGTYTYQRWGEIAPHHINLLPPGVLNEWVTGTLKTKSGHEWVEDVNKTLPATRKIPFAYEGISQALHDGRLTIPFVILQCVAYPEDVFERLLESEKHPKPKGEVTTGGKRRRVKKESGTPKKVLKTRERQVKKEEDFGEEQESDGYEEGPEGSDSDEYATPVSRRVSTLPKRASPRRATRAESVEL
ncbi:hypothetical protein FB45DRAFT_799086 [Roridomyces roridus]|uniref:DUF6697 domain-containing protein n=1 Tax=Roridomyces roridus TaxID=1738132 RepID=A0AAD7FFL3_9AGAR|nr:hypothetical protein FB45DRAFT_799086 [Roridomyces roridus]